MNIINYGRKKFNNIRPRVSIHQTSYDKLTIIFWQGWLKTSLLKLGTVKRNFDPKKFVRTFVNIGPGPVI
jgi:hypothetical protein